jgi:hypothetical protein
MTCDAKYLGNEIDTSEDSNLCVYKEDVYENNEQWTPDKCTTCRCNKGNIVCNPRECPTLRCPGRERKLADECCPICPEDDIDSDENGKLALS